MPSCALYSGARSPSGRAGAWTLFLLASLVCLELARGPASRAQGPAAKAEPAAKAAPPAKEAPPADAEAKGEAAPAPTNASSADAGTAPAQPRSMLSWAIHASGPIGLFLLCLSIYFTAMVIRLFMEMRVSEAVPTTLVEKLEAAIKERKFQEAYDACRDNDSFLARLVRTGVANLPNGRPEAKEAMSDVSEELVTGMEARISYLAIIGTLGPMIGLVGTIWGMIMSFQTIATAAGSQPRPEKVAEGISTALFITLEGVSLSVPAIFFFAFFRNRIAMIAMEANRVADRTISSLVAAAKQPQPPKPA
jgi:biopolymer transport protein ExbB